MQDQDKMEENISSGIVMLLQMTPDRSAFKDIPTPFKNAMLGSQFGVIDRVLVKLRLIVPLPLRLLRTVAEEVAPYAPYLKEWVAYVTYVKSQLPRMLYVSSRGLPLLAQTPMDKPIVCLENCVKWHSIQLLDHTGEVQEISYDSLNSLTIADPTWVEDNCIHPKLLLALGKSLNAHVDILSLEVAAGRWLLNRNLPYFGGYPVEDDETL